MRRSPGAGVLAALVAGGLGALACEQRATPSQPAAPSASPLASSAGAAASPSASAAPAAASHALAGEWRGEYESRLHRIEMSPKLSGLKAWAEDDGSKGSGKGALTVTVSADGAATGTASGPLGDATLAGTTEGDGELRLTLRPRSAAPTAFGGTLLLERKGDALEGSLRASTGDSLVARGGTAKLTRATAP